MCVRTVFYNTYNDGQEDVTERIESCTPGYICPNPVLVQYNRTYNCSRPHARTSQVQPDRSWKALPSLGRRRRTDRRSGAPGPIVPEPPLVRPIPIKRAATMAHASTERVPERGRRPIIIEDRLPHTIPGGVANTAPAVPVEVLTHSSSPRHRNSYRHQHYYPSTHTATTAATTAASTTATVGAGTRSDYLSPHTAAIKTNSTGSRSSSRHQHHRHSGDDHSPRGYGSAEDDRERSGRRRRRHDARLRASVESSSVPALGSADMFSNSFTKEYSMFDSSRGGGGYGGHGGYSSYGSSPSSPVSPASPASPASPSAPSSPASVSKKELRWEDEERRWQNARISMRPKPDLRLPTATAAVLPPQQGEVKSILKNGSPVPATPIEERSPWTGARASPRTSPRAFPRASPQTAASPVSNPADHSDLDDVFGAFSGLGIHGRRDSAEQQRQQSPHLESEEQRRQDRLRDRFSMPPPPPLARRFTAGGSFKQRTSFWYP